MHTEIINADPNCANSSSSIALITRLFTEALKKPLNCHSQQLKNIYRDKDWEKGVWGCVDVCVGVTHSSTGWPDGPFQLLKAQFLWTEIKLDTCAKHSHSLVSLFSFFSLLSMGHTTYLKGKKTEKERAHRGKEEGGARNRVRRKSTVWDQF